MNAAFSRRQLCRIGLGGALASAGGMPVDEPGSADVHRELLERAARLESQRRARFAAVRSRAELEALQQTLRETFLRLLGGFPERAGTPPATRMGRIEADDYFIDRLAFESFPGYFVPALLYRPKSIAAKAPGVISPCGHSAIGKAANEYQILHINLAKRGLFVLTYDPVGQSERSQFWDAARHRSRFNLGCGEHAVIGNALYLLGTNLARYRIWDGLRAIDYLASLPEVDASRIGCVGNSGGGNLTAYLAALEPRITVAAPCCYITTLPRRMANRTQEDPSADPEQDIFGFVSEGIDHAGLLALCAPRPLLLGTARFDFFPIAGARESFAEAQKLYEAAGAGDRIARAEAAEKHGLTRPLRQAVYAWFDRWLAGREQDPRAEEIPVAPRSAAELQVCASGQASVSLHSRPLLPLALEQFRAQPRPRRQALRDVLALDLRSAQPLVTELQASPTKPRALVVCINGNEAPEWRPDSELIQALARAQCATVALDPRGVGRSRARFAVPGHDYADPLSGVEENLAYNAFLVGQSLLALRVADVVAAVKQMAAARQPLPIVLCARRDAALVAAFAAAVEPSIEAVATEELLTSYLPLVEAVGYPLNASSIAPGLFRDFGDIPDVLEQIAPRRVLVSAGRGAMAATSTRTLMATQFTSEPDVLIAWLKR